MLHGFAGFSISCGMFLRHLLEKGCPQWPLFLEIYLHQGDVNLLLDFAALNIYLNNGNSVYTGDLVRKTTRVGLGPMTPCFLVEKS